MKAQVDQLTTMSETLQSAGFSQEQSNAVIKSVALAMEKFAVTPEILDDRIGKVMEEMRNQFAAQGEDIRAQREDIRTRGEDIKELQRSVVRLERSMVEHQRSTLRYMMLFTLLLLSAVVGSILTQIF